MKFNLNRSQCWQYSSDLRIRLHDQGFTFFENSLGKGGAQVAVRWIGLPMTLAQTAIEIVAAVAIIFESLIKAAVHLVGAGLSDKYRPANATKHITIALLVTLYTPFGVTIGNVICFAGYTFFGEAYSEYAKGVWILFGELLEEKVFPDNSNGE